MAAGAGSSKDAIGPIGRNETPIITFTTGQSGIPTGIRNMKSFYHLELFDRERFRLVRVEGDGQGAHLSRITFAGNLMSRGGSSAAVKSAGGPSHVGVQSTFHATHCQYVDNVSHANKTEGCNISFYGTRYGDDEIILRGRDAPFYSARGSADEVMVRMVRDQEDSYLNMFFVEPIKYVTDSVPCIVM
eukprot:gnl/Hemi2/17371_TR5771_c0_g1_i1.p1 gnl/Hemi2/17371_TR5771_c0_g1~~gnl/Hemi2/17371_TR5771_c0_g1_i1.p1  ORF type:complete len:188 (+),score=57.58 gnl/Hemi2/17371_TR5771_c0_g1_i1:135-698(+)